MKKPSFFSRITGGSDAADYDDYFEEERSTTEVEVRHMPNSRIREAAMRQPEIPQEPEMGELAVDVYQTPDAIVIKAFIAGVQPNSVDISLTREMVTITGTRQDEKEVEEDGYYQQELFWGSFSRTILLPEEVDVDLAEASEKHGILVLRLPKVNKKKQTKLKVKSK